ncbi:MAG TPA: hypothetical protein VFW78_10655, partial [Bacteroidia bacterium]|nr:hypothetical protein [Bacteroidia bacterium]
FSIKICVITLIIRYLTKEDPGVTSFLSTSGNLTLPHMEFTGISHTFALANLKIPHYTFRHE